MPLNLLEKTELWVHEILLDRVNLTDLADVVGGVLGLQKGQILVVDVREEHITLDVVAPEVSQEKIMGKEPEILAALRVLPGVTLGDGAYLHADGILGLICLQAERPDEIVGRVNDMTNEIQKSIAKRAIVHPTGFELQRGLIEDTNTPFLVELLRENGYKAEAGPPADDSPESMDYHLSEALSRGFGLILTTGGVGAEDKDHTVEAILRQDPQAATPYIAKFTQGTGRHIKDGVRIAVGQVGPSLMVALPGPNDEVRAAAPVLLDGLSRGLNKEELAASLADVLARKWLEKGIYGHHHGQDLHHAEHGEE